MHRRRKAMHRILPPRHTLTFQAKTRLICFAMCGVGWGVFLQADRGLAQESSVPWECTGYADEARLRCMNTLLELQQKKITELEQQLHAQEETVKVLEEKMERRKALARREAQAKRQDHRYPPPP